MGNSSSTPNEAAKDAPQVASEVPEKMRALMLTKHIAKISDQAADYEGCFEVQEIDVPTPRKGQVLVKMERSPINPSDLSNLQGSYNSAQRKPLPCQLGFEGCGIVVATGGGFSSWGLLGKRVAISSTGGGVMWSEYAIGIAIQAIKIPDDATPEQGSSCFVNPMTALAFIDIAQGGSHAAIVHTAGASALGKMVIRHGVQQGVGTIAVVRKESQVEELMALGAKAVIVTTQDGWEAKLTEACEEHKANLAFDAVAGQLTGQVLKAMPNGSEVRVYGGMSQQACASITPTDLIFKGKKVTGFWLTAHMGGLSMLGKAGFLRRVANNLTGTLATKIRMSYPIDQFAQAFADYCGNMSEGKICFGPSLEEACEPAAAPVEPVEEEEEQKQEDAADEDDSAKPEAKPKDETTGEQLVLEAFINRMPGPDAGAGSKGYVNFGGQEKWAVAPASIKVGESTGPAQLEGDQYVARHLELAVGEHEATVTLADGTTTTVTVKVSLVY